MGDDFEQRVFGFAQAVADSGGAPITVTRTTVVRPRTERQKRGETLAALAEVRARAVSLARGVAVEIAQRAGTVTSPEVLAELRARGHGALLDSVDRRFMGVVFNRGWERVGWQNGGSHARPVPVWRIR